MGRNAEKSEYSNYTKLRAEIKPYFIGISSNYNYLNKEKKRKAVSTILCHEDKEKTDEEKGVMILVTPGRRLGIGNI